MHQGLWLGGANIEDTSCRVKQLEEWGIIFSDVVNPRDERAIARIPLHIDMFLDGNGHTV